jgi:hypothetical protein
MAGRYDSTIANSTGDAHECNVYTKVFQYDSCAKGFDAAYHYTYMGPLAIIAATTVHCNANNNVTNSCYDLGENDGIDAARALIKICHRTAPQEPSGHHSAQYVLGFKTGWQNTNRTLLPFSTVPTIFLIPLASVNDPTSVIVTFGSS